MSNLSKNEIKAKIDGGNCVLGIEFGSTRIKAVLTDDKGDPIASGGHGWENRLENGVWTYTLDDIWDGLRDCYADLVCDVKEKYGTEIHTLGALGFSAMMHGYMPFDKDGRLLTPFRTWRNTMTARASEELTKLFGFHIPQRWSIAHLYQAVLNNEEHVRDIDFITTLDGYVCRGLCGEKGLGIGSAAGMFPIDSAARDYNSEMLEKFDLLVADRNYPWKIRDILPRVLIAGEKAGTLTEEGARLLDPSGTLSAGIPLCPPEGDAGTGMVATNSVRPCTGNVSAGTSVFAMAVLDKELGGVYDEIDAVTTPCGDPVAMVHCNNCTSDINAWADVFGGLLSAAGAKVDNIYEIMFGAAAKGDPDCGGLLAYNYFSGEHITGFEEGRPLLARTPGSKFTFENFMRVNLYTALGALKIGMDILFKKEKLKLKCIFGHGGFFKTKNVGQSIVAAALDTPVSVMNTAGEGGAWGMALLALYMIQKEDGENLADYLSDKIFADAKVHTLKPRPDDVKGFDEFEKRYISGLAIERAAVESIKD